MVVKVWYSKWRILHVGGSPQYKRTKRLLAPEIAGLLGNSGLIQPIMRFQNHYYLMVNGKTALLTPTALWKEGLHFKPHHPNHSNWTNATRPEDISLAQNNSFVKYGASSAIYLYSGNQFFSIPDFETYTNWAGQSPVAVLDSSSNYNTAPPTATAALQHLGRQQQHNLTRWIWQAL